MGDKGNKDYQKGRADAAEGRHAAPSWSWVWEGEDEAKEQADRIAYREGYAKKLREMNSLEEESKRPVHPEEALLAISVDHISLAATIVAASAGAYVLWVDQLNFLHLSAWLPGIFKVVVSLVVGVAVSLIAWRKRDTTRKHSNEF